MMNSQWYINFIKINNTGSTQGLNIYGIKSVSGTLLNLYHNTVVIAGGETSAASTNCNSYCYQSMTGNPTTFNVKNNIFINNRTTTNNVHYAIWLVTNPGSVKIDNNYLEVENTNKICLVASTDYTITTWNNLSGVGTDTDGSANNLRKEGHTDSVYVTGNTVVDALHHVSQLLTTRSNIQLDLEAQLGFSLTERFILFTQHRREGFGDGQTSVFESILELADAGHKIIFPVHLNPRVQDNAQRMLSGHKNIFLISPQPYLPFIQLLQKCLLLISDSGGLQEEAPSFGKRIIITRKTTERAEVLESGWGTLVGFDKQLIVSTALQAIEKPNLTTAPNPFGDGQASLRIVDHLVGFCSNH